MPKLYYASLAFVTAFTFLQGCKEADFKGGSKVVQNNEELALACEIGKPASEGVREVKGSGAKKIKVNGQFCSPNIGTMTAQKSTTVLYIVDHSGSMGKADPGNGSTCARRDGGSLALQKLQSSSSSGAQAALISFSSGANVDVPLMPISQFMNVLTFQNFCGQNGRSTNYEAAFQAATRLLANVAGPKLVLFFSDGLPGTGGSGLDAKTRGLQAANQLRALPDLKLRIAYLHLPNNLPNMILEQPRDYLIQVAGGNPNDVQIATSASQFVEQVGSIAVPQSSMAQANLATAVLRAAGFPERNIKVKLKQVGVGLWQYETELFELLGNPNAMTVNELIVTAISSNGQNPESRVLINFTRSR